MGDLHSDLEALLAGDAAPGIVADWLDERGDSRAAAVRRCTEPADVPFALRYDMTPAEARAAAVAMMNAFSQAFQTVAGTVVPKFSRIASTLAANRVR